MAWPWDDINALGDRLASGYDPRDPAPPSDLAQYGNQANQIIADLYQQYPGLGQQPPNVQQQLYSTVISGLKDNKGDASAVTAVLPSVASKIVSEAQTAGTALNRLGPGTTDSGGPWSTDKNGWMLLPNGNRMDPQTGKIFDSNGNVVAAAPQGRTAAEEAASNASASANNANANRTNILAGIDLQNAARAGQDAGHGYTWMPDGSTKPNGQLTDKDSADIQNANKLALIAQQNADTNRLTQQDNKAYQTGELANTATRNANDAAYQTGQLGIGQEGNRLKGVELGNTAAYQQGQLNQGEQRLGLDTAVAQADAAAKAQQNNLARQQYISKVLSSPSDFISRAFMQRGEASPLSQVTHADLINQVNREFANAPTAFTAPQAPGNTLLQPNAPPPTSAYASGTSGMVNDRLAIVGDPQVNGVPNPEVIHNPTGAPISIVPLNRLQQAGDTNGGDTPWMPPRWPNPGDAGGAGPNPLEDANGEQNWNGDIMPTNSREPSPEEQQTQKKVDALSRLLQHVETPSTQHALVDEIASHRGRLKAYADGSSDGGQSVSYNASTGMLSVGSGPSNISGVGTGALGVTTGSPTSGSSSTPTSNTSWSTQATANPNYRPSTSAPGYTGANIPGITQPSLSIPQLMAPIAPAPIVSQHDLVTQAQNNLPTALRQLFGGDATRDPFNTVGGTQNPQNNTGISPLNFGFNLFSPQSLAQLTDAEKQALDSYLGVKYNTTLADVATGMQQTFGRLSGGSATGSGRLAHA